MCSAYMFVVVRTAAEEALCCPPRGGGTCGLEWKRHRYLPASTQQHSHSCRGLELQHSLSCRGLEFRHSLSCRVLEFQHSLSCRGLEFRHSLSCRVWSYNIPLAVGSWSSDIPLAVGDLQHHLFSPSPPVAIERLSPCKRLCSLVLSHNSVDAIRSVDCCHNLWYLDLSGNKVGPPAVSQSVRVCVITHVCRVLRPPLYTRVCVCVQVKGVGGLSRFPVFGVLNLACNDLGWEELRRLSHMTLLSLSLLGNTKLDSDPHCK